MRDVDDFLVANESDIGLNIKIKNAYHRDAVGHTAAQGWTMWRVETTNGRNQPVPPETGDSFGC